MKCRCCGETFDDGCEVIREGYSGDFFCDTKCYREFVRNNLDDYWSYIEEIMSVGMTRIEEE